MIKRNTDYYKEWTKGQSEKTAEANRRIANAIENAKSEAKRWSTVFSVNYVVFCVLTLYFIMSRLLVGGFYSMISHTAAIIILFVGVALLVGGIIFHIIMRWLRGGVSFIRRFLYVAAAVIAIASTIILGFNLFFIFAVVCFGIVTLLFEIVNAKKSKDGFSKSMQKALSVLILVSTVSSCLFFFAPGYNYAGSDKYVETVSYSRTVRYEKADDGGAKLNKVMLTALDAFRIKTGEPYVIDTSVGMNGEDVPVTVIGERAFREVGSFDTVILPDTVTAVETGAFINSAIKTLEISSPRISFGDVFADSEVKDIIMTSPDEVSIISCENIPGDARIHVPRDLFDKYVEKNPSVKYNIVPILAETEIFVMFDIDVPVGTDKIDRYVESYVLEKDESGSVSVSLPYSAYKTNTEDYGAHWARVIDGRAFRLFELTAGESRLTANDARITVSESTWVVGAWREMHYLYADLSEFGGGIVKLEEYNVNSDKYDLPTEYYYENADGYVCNTWHQNSDLVGETVTSVTDFSKDLTVYPRFTLLPPTLSANDYTAQYDAEDHTVTVTYTHDADVTPSIVSWKKDGVNYNVSGGRTDIVVRNVSDSGIYTCELTVKDAFGRFASAMIDIKVSITPAPLAVTADAKESVYNTPFVPLTYTHGALLGEDTLNGELSCAFGSNAGVYAIEQGTISAGGNYAIDYTGANYTVTKATYDMSGITFEGGTFTYNGTDFTPVISEALLPVGADGIKVGVTYEGDGVNSGTKTLTARFSTESVNYYAPDPMTCEITVNKADAEIDTSGIGVFTYNGSLQTVNSGAVLNHNECALSYSNNTFTTVAEGNGMIVTVTAAETRNYNSQSADVAITVLKADAVIDTSGIGVYVYNGSEQTVTGATLNHTEAALEYHNNTFTTVFEGNGKEIIIRANETDNYKSANVTFAIVVEKAVSVINTDGMLKDYVYNGMLQTVTGGATLNHSEAVIEYSNNTFTTVAEGRALGVLVSVPESANYKAESVTVMLNVEKADTVIDPAGVNTEYVYTGSEQTVSGGAVFNHGETELVYTNNTFVTVAEGDGMEVLITAPESDNYKSASVTVAINVEKAETLINTDGVLKDYVYNGSLQTVTDGAVLNHNECNPEYSDNTFTTVAEGDGMVVTVTAPESANYKSASTTVTINVEKADAVIDTDGVISEYVYTGSEQTVDSGAVLNHGESSLVYSNNTFTTVAEGYGLVVQIDASESANYKAASAAVKIIVDRAETVINTDGMLKDYVYNGSLQTVTGGATINHSEAVIEYSNNTFTTVAEGRALSVLVSVPESENYKAASVTFSINVEKADAVIDPAGVNTEYVYTGSEQTVDSGATLNHGETELVYTNNTFTTVSEGDGMEVIITAPESENYKAASVTVTINVEKAESIIDTAGVEKNYTFNGMLQTVNSGATLNHEEATLEYSDNTFTTVAEGNGKTVTVSVAESDNYKSASVTLTINVEKAEAVIETVGVEKNYTYNGSLQTVNSGAILNHSETELVYTNNTFTTVAEGEGMEVVISAPESDNYKEARETVTISVEKAESLIDTAGVITDYIYTGSLQTVDSGATLNHSEATLEYSNNTFTTVAEGNGKEITVSVAESDNYKAASEKVIISVTRMKVALPVYTDTEFAYNGEEIVFIENDADGYYTVTDGSATEIGSYDAKVELNDTLNCVWEDDDFTGSISWSIV